MYVTTCPKCQRFNNPFPRVFPASFSPKGIYSRFLETPNFLFSTLSESPFRDVGKPKESGFYISWCTTWRVALLLVLAGTNPETCCTFWWVALFVTLEKILRLHCASGLEPPHPNSLCPQRRDHSLAHRAQTDATSTRFKVQRGRLRKSLYED